MKRYCCQRKIKRITILATKKGEVTTKSELIRVCFCLLLIYLQSPGLGAVCILSTPLARSLQVNDRAIFKLHASNVRAQAFDLSGAIKVIVSRKSSHYRRRHLIYVLLGQALVKPQDRYACLPASWNRDLQKLVYHFHANAAGRASKGW